MRKYISIYIYGRAEADTSGPSHMAIWYKYNKGTGKAQADAAAVQGGRRNVPRDREASETAGQDIRHIPTEGRKPCRAVLQLVCRDMRKIPRRCAGSGTSDRRRKKGSGTEAFLSLPFFGFSC